MANIIGFSGLAGSGKDAAANFLVESHGYVKVALADPIKRIAKDLYAFTDQQLWGPSQFRNEPDQRYLREHGPWTPDRKCVCCGIDFDGLYPSVSNVVVLIAPPSKCYLTPRHTLQQIGTELGRSCYPDTWVDVCIRTAKELLANPYNRYSQKRGLYDGGVDEYHLKTRPRGVAISDVRFGNEIRAIQAAGGKVIRIGRPGAGLKGVQGQHLSESEQTTIPDSAFDAIIHNTGTLDDLRLAVEKAVADSDRPRDAKIST